MENLTAYLYLLMGLGCVIIYRLLKKRWNIQNNNKNNLFKFLLQVTKLFFSQKGGVPGRSQKSFTKN